MNKGTPIKQNVPIQPHRFCGKRFPQNQCSITTSPILWKFLAQYAATSFVITEIVRCRLHDDKLCWRWTKFKLVAYISNLLGSNNVKYNVLGKGMKEMLGITGDPS